MNAHKWIGRCLLATAMAILTNSSFAQTSAPADSLYKLVNTVGFLSGGRFDFFATDSEARRLYIPRGGDIMIFNLDTLEEVKIIDGVEHGYGMALDPVSHHGFASGNHVFMWDTTTDQKIKMIDVPGTPYKNILFEPLTEHIFVFNHPLPPPAVKAPATPAPAVVAPVVTPTTPPAADVPATPAPSVTVLDGKDGSIVGSFDLDGAPEQAVSDGEGHIYVDLKDKDSVAVIDVKTLKQTAIFPLGAHAELPCGLAMDIRNHILFVSCLNSSNAIMLDATTGKVLQDLPLGKVPEVFGFNPQTNEAFSSEGAGSLTIIKEDSPTSFAIEQTVSTFTHSRTCALDTKTNHIIVIAPEHLDQAPAPNDPPMPTMAKPAAPPANSSTVTDANGKIIPTPKMRVALHIFVFGR